MADTPKKIFHRLSANHPLVEELASGNHAWWDRLVRLSHADHDINIQVRGKYLNVYCKMANLLKIELTKGKVVCKVHYKYLVGTYAQPYITAYPSGNDIEVKQKTCDFVRSILDEKSLKVIKGNISTYAGEEKKIQSHLIEKNKDTILDVEIAFSGKDEQADSSDDSSRIDFANYDKNRRCLVFIELKQIFDPRLYSNEINVQIQKYVAFAKKNANQLKAAYNDVIQVKKKLGIISPKSYLWDVEISSVEYKPILAIAGYNQNIIDGMKPKICEREKDNLDDSKLAALYFFGTNADLNLKKDKNKELFI